MYFFPTRQIAFELFGFPVHWYGILYLLAFLVAYHLIRRLQRRRSLDLSSDDISSIMSWAIAGVIIGGRLGFVFFYEWSYFLTRPIEILFVWNGGMSSHGGFIGVAVALYIILKKRGVPILPFLDIITVPIAIGLALGRFGNFINWELYGTVTAVPWAIEIPGVEGLRHPTFFYSIAKNLFIAAVCSFYLARAMRPYGMTFALFLLLYGALRFAVEHFREQTYPLTDIGIISLTQGQLLTLPIVFVGFVMVMWLHSRNLDLQD